jgi:hypothetical protein|tara:strand:- start:2615 stop:2902 length:288 start_codon:yes stop_codon:yes gene_type:complete
MNREQRRSAAKQAKKDGDVELEEKITLFGKLPDHCMVCEDDFDKNNKEMVQDWSVVVHDKKEQVRLYCPSCWEQAVKLVEEVMYDIGEKLESGDE